MFVSPFRIPITLLGEEGANLSAFRTFVRFALVWFCLSSSFWCLGRAAAYDCSPPWTFLLPFFYIPILIIVVTEDSRIYPKYFDKQVSANNVDSNQTRQTTASYQGLNGSEF